jgi:RNA polymerase nonessential primary-like sigma factor
MKTPKSVSQYIDTDLPFLEEDWLEENETLLNTDESFVFEAQETEALLDYDPSTDPLRIYFNALNHTHFISASQERALINKAQAGNIDARNKLIESHLRLVTKIAQRYLNRGLDLLDLIEEGNLGLLKSISRFDIARNFRFSSYAQWWIRESIETALMNQTRTIRLPIHMIKELSKCLHAAQEFETQHAIKAKFQEIADKVDLPLDIVLEIMALNEPLTSFDRSLVLEGEFSLEDIVPNETPDDPEMLYQQSDTALHLNDWISALPEKERFVVEHRFGLSKHKEELTLEAIAEKLDLTKERVRQLQNHALAVLKEKALETGMEKNDLDLTNSNTTFHH